MGENISWYLKDQVAVIKGQGEMDRTCDLGAGVKTAGGLQRPCTQGHY